MDDTEFFLKLYKDYINELLRYAKRWVDEYLAEDLVAETYLAAWEDIHKVQKHTAPRKWLYKTLYHKCTHEVERKSYQMEISMEMSAFDAIYSDEKKSISALIPKGISPAEEKLLRMRYEDNADFQDIAEFLGIKEVAARKRVARAVAKCRKILMEDISEK